jgi:hypothetical protein
MIKKNCDNCNLEFNANTKSTKYCSECRKIKNKEIWKRYRDSHKEQRLAYDKEYKKNNKDVIALRMKEYNKNYKQEHKEERKIYRKEQKNDPKYKIETKVRGNFNRFFNSKNNDKYSELVGCNLKQFKKWIEFNFDSKMNWDNYNTYWNIDHILPVKIFNLENDDEKIFCFNWKNTRPLEAYKNFSRKFKFFDLLLHELKIQFFLKQNSDIKSINYRVSNLQNHARNCLMDLVNC